MKPTPECTYPSAMRTLPICALVLLTLSGCGPTEIAPDLHGTLVLGQSVEAPTEGILCISARDTSSTREGRSLEMKLLRVDVRDVTFPFEFVLEGQGGPATHTKWRAVATVHPEGDCLDDGANLGGATEFELRCEPSGDEDRKCADAEVELVLERA